MATNSLLDDLLEEMERYGLEENDVEHVQDFSGLRRSTFAELKECIRNVYINRVDENLLKYLNLCVMFEDCCLIFDMNPLSWKINWRPYPVSERAKNLSEYLNHRSEFLNG